MEKLVKIGTMPGIIREVVLETGITVTEALRVADFDQSGYDVKVDGVTVADTNAKTITGSTNLILLVKKVKGN